MDTVKTVIVTYYERLPGNIAVDPEGRELPFKRDTIYSVYAETTVNPDSWDQIVIKGSLYNITGEPQLLPDSVVVSDKKNHENLFPIRTSGSSLWKLNLERATLPESHHVTSDSSYLKLTIRGRSITKKIEKIAEFEGLPTY